MALQYHLRIQCIRGRATPATNRCLPRAPAASRSLNIDDPGSMVPTASVGDITPEERENLALYSGFRQKLSIALAGLWQIHEKAIQIGATVVTKTGATVHVVQLTKMDGINAAAAELFGSAATSEVDPLFVVRRFYEFQKAEVNRMFRRHFHIGSAFEVVFQDLDDSKQSVSRAMHWSRDSDPESHGIDGEAQITAALHSFCGDDEGVSFENKRSRIIQMLNTMDSADKKRPLCPGTSTSDAFMLAFHETDESPAVLRYGADDDESAELELTEINDMIPDIVDAIGREQRETK